jgi:hypothetical protein
MPDYPIIEEITDFIIKYSSYIHRDKIKEFIQKHIEYNTCMYLTDKNGEIAAVVRWNVIDNGRVAHVLDLIIREDFRNNGMIKTLLIKGLMKFPTVRYLSWERLGKYPKRKPRIYSIWEILKRRKVNG